jgi:hypothetical protein
MHLFPGKPHPFVHLRFKKYPIRLLFALNPIFVLRILQEG